MLIGEVNFFSLQRLYFGSRDDITLPRSNVRPTNSISYLGLQVLHERNLYLFCKKKTALGLFQFVKTN